ncbi:MAG: hypothetical protein HRT63_02030 [Erythrobacter sp.]|nr:hypothetical protein [Erythrobacter sp.]
MMNMGSASRSRNGGFHEAVDADRQVLRPKGELCGAIGPQTPHILGARHCRAMPNQGAIAPARAIGHGRNGARDTSGTLRAYTAARTPRITPCRAG